MNNNLNFQFGMYEPTTDSIIVNTGENAILVIVARNAIPPLSLMIQLILYIYTDWQRKPLCYMPNWH